MLKIAFAASACVLTFSLQPVRADLRPEKVHVAENRKANAYVHDGLITGGDRAIDEIVVKDIRRAVKGDYERIVIDLEGSMNGDPAAIQRPSYYQVAVTPDEKRVVFSLWGKPTLSFNAKQVQAAFRKSAVVQNLVLLPKMEDGLWTFAFDLKAGNAVEVFELPNPVRIIMDIRRHAGAAPTDANSSTPSNE